LRHLKVGAPPQTYDGPKSPRDSELLHSVLDADRNGVSQYVLEIGCGDRTQESCFAHRGMKYVGFDVTGSQADLIADAHFIPFRDSSFDTVFSHSVWEHLNDPHSAAAEVARVLSPGGLFFGVVSQGEPFHDSYFHHTAWGLASLAASSGLTLHRLWGARTTIEALSRMGRYMGPTRLALRLLGRINDRVAPLTPRRQKFSNDECFWDELHTSGSIAFVFRKP
jgi:SAM-dependent methyltransferase